MEVVSHDTCMYEFQINTKVKVYLTSENKYRYMSIQCLYNGLADTNPYAVFVSISTTSPFIFLLVPTSSYTVAGSVGGLGLYDSLDLLEM